MFLKHRSHCLLFKVEPKLKIWLTYELLINTIGNITKN